MSDEAKFVERIPAMAAIVDLDEVDESQIFFPDLDDNGELILLPGEQVILTFNGVGLGSDIGASPVASARGKIIEVDSVVIVTNQRLVVVAKKFDSGGGWESGSLLAAGVLNAASKIRAKMRSRGKALVGQVRWPWLLSMRYREKAGLVSLDSVIELQCQQMVLEDGKQTAKNAYLAIQPHKKVDVMSTAKAIFDAAVADRLTEGLNATAEQAIRATSFNAATPGRMEYNTVGLPEAFRRQRNTAHHGRFTSLSKPKD